MSREPASGRLVMLTRGKVGYEFMAGDKSPQEYNFAAGLTYEQVEAMEYGALLGFDVDLADPNRVRSVRQQLGQPVGPIRDPAEIPPRELRPRPETPPKLLHRPDEGNFLPDAAAVLAKRNRPSWG
jgi:hypothetical protein